MSLIFHTSAGDVHVNNWGYQLQGNGDNSLDTVELAKASHDLLVMDFSGNGSGASAFTTNEIAAIRNGTGGKTVAVAYISIGEASEFRDHWNPNWTQDGSVSAPLSSQAPAWLGPVNPDWPESRKVRYWDPDWQHIIYNDQGTGWLDTIVAQGFDGAYLDIVDAYYFWANTVAAADRRPGDPLSNDQTDAAQRMIDFITALTAHARQSNPDFFVIPQNGAFIIDALQDNDPVRKSAFLDAVAAIGVEDVYLPGNAEENNPFAPDMAIIDVLQRDFLHNDIPVLSVDYVNSPVLLRQYTMAAGGNGFLPYAAPSRGLDSLAGPFEENGASDANNNLTGTPGNDTIDSLSGNDTLSGLAGNDILNGGNGNDVVDGGKGDDTLGGGQGTDYLIGMSGNDTLTGGEGNDYLNGGEGNDIYLVDDTFDVIDEGFLLARYGFGGTDTLIIRTGWFWDYYGVGETLQIDESLNAIETTIIGGIWDNGIYGNSGANILFGRGGSDHYHPGAGIDFISFSTLGVTDANAYAGVNGVNTLVMEIGNGYDIVFDFETGRDKIDLTAFGLPDYAALQGAGYNDGYGNSYFILGPDGTDYLYVMGLETTSFTAGDFVLT
jgi:cysteinyl-tRNA synthetase